MMHKSMFSYERLYGGIPKELPDSLIEQEIGLALKDHVLIHLLDSGITHTVPFARGRFKRATGGGGTRFSIFRQFLYLP